MSALRTYRNATGAPTYYVDEYDAAGRRRRVRLGRFTSKTAAQVSFANYLKQRENGRAGLPARAFASLADLLTVWLEAKRPDVTPLHFKNLEAHARDLLAVLGADTPLAAIDEGAAARLKAALQVRRAAVNVRLRNGKTLELKRKTPTVAGTINRKVATLKAALAFAVSRGWLGKNPLAAVAKLSDARPPVWRWLRPDEVERLLSVLRNGAPGKVERVRRIKINGRRRKVADAYETTIHCRPDLLAVVTFAVNTGARRGEIFATTWADVDLAGGRVRIVGTKAAARGRAARPRFIPLNVALRQLLERMKGEAEAAGRYKAEAAIFDPAMKPGVAKRLAGACKLAGLERLRFHDLRHTFGANLASSGISLAVVKELLGHSSYDLTTRYAHLSAGALAEAVNVLNFGAQGAGAEVLSVTAQGADVAQVVGSNVNLGQI